MRSYWIWVGPIPLTDPCRREIWIKTHRENTMQRWARGVQRLEYCSYSQRKANNHWWPPEAARQGCILPQSPCREHSPATPWFQTWSLLSCERMRAYCSKLPSWWHFATAALGKNTGNLQCSLIQEGRDPIMETGELPGARQQLPLIQYPTTLYWVSMSQDIYYVPGVALGVGYLSKR